MADRIPYGAWPRYLNTDQAAAYSGTTRGPFLREVEAGVWPAPVRLRGRSFWDRYLLDQVMNLRSGLDEEPDLGEQEALRAIDEHRTA